MTSYVEFAHYDQYYNQLEVRYVVNHVGMVQNKRSEFLETGPKGDWVTLVFDPEDAPTYSEFLNTMVYMTLDVARKMCLSELNAILEHPKTNSITHCELLSSIYILDNTFDTPVINVSCRWQRELVYDIVSTHFKAVISTCKNITNMIKLFKVLRTI